VDIRPNVQEWQRISTDYSPEIQPFARGLAAEIESVLKRAGIRPPASLLEVGCGSGHLSACLKSAGYATTLGDFAPDAIDASKEAWKAALPDDESTRFLHLDINRLDKDLEAAGVEDKHDVVWNSGLVEHFSRRSLVGALDQMRRASKDAVLILVPNSESLIYLAYRFRIAEMGKWNVGVEMLRTDYVSAAREAGLSVVDSGYCGEMITESLLDSAIHDQADRDRLTALLRSGVTPRHALYLRYLLLRPTEVVGETPSVDGGRPPHEAEHDVLSRTFAVDALGIAHSNVAGLTRALDSATKDRERLVEKLDQTEQRLLALESKHAEITSALQTERENALAKLNELRADLTEANANYAFLEERLKEEIAEASALRERSAELTAERDALSARLESSEADRAETAARLEGVSSELRQVETKAHELAERAEHDTRRLHDELTASTNRVAVLEERLERELAETAAFRDRAAELQTERDELSASLESSETDRAEIAQRLEDVSSELRQVEAKAHELTASTNRVAVLEERLGAAETARVEIAQRFEQAQAHGDAEINRLREALEAANHAVHMHAKRDEQIRIAKEAADRLATILDTLRTHKSIKLAHMAELAKTRLFKGSLVDRGKFVAKAALRVTQGKYREEFGRAHPLSPPASMARAVSDKLNGTPVRPDALCTAEDRDRSMIPPADPCRLPVEVERAPHGKRRVAYLTNQLVDWNTLEPRFGGGERYCVTLAELLRDLGMEVQFFQPAARDADADYHGFPVRCDKHRFADYSEFNIGAAEWFAELSRDYDHVVYNLPEFSNGPMREDAIMICHGIWFDHDNYPAAHFRSKPWFGHLGRAFSSPARIVSVDTNSINVIRAIWPELALRMRFIPNFYDADKFRVPDGSRHPGPLRVLFPRRSQINRGSRILGDIIGAIPEDVRFHWVGEGDPEDTQMILDLAKMDKRLTFHRADFNEMPFWYRHADISVIPTIACEGMSLSCIEALASGSATVSTHVGGLSDIIHEGYNGLLVDPDPASIAKAIRKLINDDDLRRHFAEIGPRSAKAFGLDRWRERWIEVLAEQQWIPPGYAEAFTPSGQAESTQAIEIEPDLVRTNPRVAIITRNAIHGGVELTVAQQAESLGADVIVAGGLERPSTCPFEYTRADTYDALKEQLRDYDVAVHHWNLPWAVQAIADSGIPNIEYVHRTDTADCDKTVPTSIAAHSPFLAEFITEQAGRKCHVVPYGLDPTRVTPPERLGKAVGAVTSYTDIKGLDVFLHAWAKIKHEFPDTPVVFYGQGIDQGKFERLARDLGVNAEFRPPVKSPAEVLDQFRIFVIPSRIEGMPLAVLEALAANIPLLTSDLPGVVDLNRTAENRGFGKVVRTFAMEDSSAMAAELRAMLKDDDRPDTRPFVDLYNNVELHANRMHALIAEAAVKPRSPERLFYITGEFTDDPEVGLADGTVRVSHLREQLDGRVDISEIHSTKAHRECEYTFDHFPRIDVPVPLGTDAIEARIEGGREGYVGYTAVCKTGDQVLRVEVLTIRFEADLRPVSIRLGNIPEGTSTFELFLRPFNASVDDTEPAANTIKSVIFRTFAEVSRTESAEADHSATLNGVAAGTTQTAESAV